MGKFKLATIVLFLASASSMPCWAHRDATTNNLVKMANVTVTDNGNLGAPYVGANAILNPD
ncbi:MAG: hypothetical protein ACYC64_18195, partial [Armatimonadota bacterium]